MRVMNHICTAVAAAAIVMAAGLADAQGLSSRLAGFPSRLVWQNKPAQWNDKDDSLLLAAGKKTDWFVLPGGGYSANSSPRLMFRPSDDFMFSSKVEVEWHATYDAGCLALYEAASIWAKLCLEAQADRRLDVVSVVTRGSSDDATSFPASGTSIYLKIAKVGGAIFFYASADGKAWIIVRKLDLQPNNGLLAGFSAQSPDGDGASAQFTDFHYLPQKIDLWKLQ